MSSPSLIVRVVLTIVLFGLSLSSYAGVNINSVSLNGGSSVTISPANSITVNIRVTTNGGGLFNPNDWRSTRYSLNGINYCEDSSDGHPSYTSSGTYTHSFSIPGSVTNTLNPGSYSISFRAYSSNSCFWLAATDDASLNNGVVVANNDSIAPVAADDTSSIATGRSVSINLAANDNDTGSGLDLSSIRIVSAPSAGTISAINNDGTVQYTHSGGAETNDSFTYTIDDIAGNTSNVATVNMTISALSCGTYRDEFGSSSYNNSDGTISWFGEFWSELNENNGADMRIISGQLRLRGNDTSNSGSETSIRRAVDLNGYQLATLTFDYSTSRGVDGDDAIVVEASIDGGNNYTEVQRYQGRVSGAQNYDLSSYVNNNVIVRFRFPPEGNNGACCYGGNNEYFYVDNFQVEACTLDASIPDPVAYWYLDGSSWSGTDGEVVDATGNGHDGRAVNGLGTSDDTPAIAGSPGTCRYADMTSSDSHFIQVPHSNDLNGTDALTYTAWIRPNSWNGVRQVMAKSVHGGGSGRAQMGIFSEGGNLRGRAETDQGRRNLDSPLPPTGTWTHVALVFDGSSLTFYHNGIEVSTTSFASSQLRANSDPFNIGKRVGTNQYLFNGAIDEVGIYKHVLNATQITSIMQQTRPCNNTPSTDHYAISFDGGATYDNGSGLTCQASAVTLIGHSADHATEVGPGDGVSINLSSSTGTGRWSSPSAGTLSNNINNNGSATYTFSTNSRVTLQFSHTQSGIVNLNTGSDSPGEDPNIEFFDAGFRFIDAADNAIGTPANPFVQIAGDLSAPFFLQAVRLDEVTQTCVAAFPAGGNKLVDLAAECSNPSACRGLQVSLSNDGNDHTVVTLDDNSAIGASSYSPNVSLRFDADSKAQMTLDYTDVGAISLHARHSILFDNGDTSGDLLLGSSNSFVVKPANLIVRPVAGTSSPMATGTGFRAAGEDFTVEVDVVNIHGAITPNFGRESSPERVKLNFSSVEFPPSGVGSDGNLSHGNFSLTATDGRLRATDVRWSEAGGVQLFASIDDGDYLNSGDDVLGTASSTIGRFYPDRFTLTNDTVENSCNDTFTYFDESAATVAYIVTAVNVGGGQLQNYDTSLGYPVARIEYVAENDNDGTDLGGRVDVDEPDWTNGVYDVNDTAAFVERAGLQAPLEQVYIGAKANDTTDGRALENPDMNAATTGDCTTTTSCDARQLDVADTDGLTLRYGRLRSKSVHGPETAALPVPFYTEYWNGTLWLPNTDDSCTSISRTDIEADSTAVGVAGDLAVTVGSGTSNGTFASFVAGNVEAANGDMGLVFSAPGAGNRGSFPLDVDLTSMDWLQFDWDGVGGDDTSLPTATINFGSYRGHDRVIYWHERFTD